MQYLLLLILFCSWLPWPHSKRHSIFCVPSLSMRPSVVENEFSLICMTDKRFFNLFNRRSYAGDLKLVKRCEKSLSGGWVGVCALVDVCGSITDPLGLVAYRAAFVILAKATFLPKLLHSEECCSLQSDWSQCFAYCGGCSLVLSFCCSRFL